VILERCLRLGLAPQRIIFELTETNSVDDPTVSLDLMTRVRMKGFHYRLTTSAQVIRRYCSW
jgi:EAL domain-containing protein (putative c-di-GMP-specific phosphodiesterase class I)